MKWNYILHIILAILFFVFSFMLNTCYASSFGQKCINVSAGDNYLQNSAFGYIKSFIDMKEYVQDPCNTDDKELKICIKNPPNSSKPCTEVSLELDRKTSLSSITSNPELVGYEQLKNIPLSVSENNDLLCLRMPTSEGLLPLACKKVNDSGGGGGGKHEYDPCSSIGKACYPEYSHSQFMFGVTGNAIYCTQETLYNILYQDVNNQCNYSNVLNDHTHSHSITGDVGLDSKSTHIFLNTINPFSEVQTLFKRAVFAIASLSVIFFMIRVLGNYEEMSLSNTGLKIITIIAVTYVALGSAMTTYILPISLNFMAEFANMIFLAIGDSSNGLCNFDLSKYPSSMPFYMVGDAIDCRLASYLLLAFSYAKSEVALLKILFGFFIGGDFLLVICGLLFALLVMSIMLQVITLLLVSIITLYVLGYLSVIFVPMILISFMKHIFTQWLHIMISCIVQLGVYLVFLFMLFSIFDANMYGSCQFKSVNRDGYTFFDIELPESDAQSCKDSVGYKLSQYAQGKGASDVVVMFFSVPIITDSLSILPGFVLILFWTIIFYYLFQYVSQFSASITGGPSMGVIIGGLMLFDAARSTFNKYSSGSGGSNSTGGGQGGGSNLGSAGSNSRGSGSGGDHGSGGPSDGKVNRPDGGSSGKGSSGGGNASGAKTDAAQLIE
ncbi:MAG: hypothetical protein AB8B67_01350 [Rickettsiaceae bacterium]